MTSSRESAVVAEPAATIPQVSPLGNPNYPVGRVNKNLPIPPVAECTKLFSAGAVVLGLERRILNETVIRDNFQEDSNRLAELANSGVPDDIGLSIHVFEAETQREILRFDMFPDFAHYHYMPAAPYHIVISYDTAANGDMFDWATNAISNRLAPMLRNTEAYELAEMIDVEAVGTAVTQLRAYADELMS
jgi:hypothetical protein